MEHGTHGRKVAELLVGILLLVVLAAVLLPALGRAREAARRASCQNNLKQMGISFRMFAGEHNGDWPRLSPTPNNWVPDMNALYPDYLNDPQVLVCPQSPFADAKAFCLVRNAEHPEAEIGQFHPDCVSSLFYVYTGFAIVSDEQAVAFLDAYHTLPYEALTQTALQLDIPIWENSDRLTKMPELGYAQAEVPVLWDQVPLEKWAWSHQVPGGNVLYMDGHVEFLRYSYYNNSSAFPMTRVSAETFGSALPRLSSDCSDF